MRASTLALTLCTVQLAVSPSLFAGDWPQWRGPNRDDVSTESGLLKEWPEGGPRLLWKATDLGEGYSTPSVSQGRIYGMGMTDGKDENVWALDAATGKPAWKARIGDVSTLRGRQGGDGPRGTPTVDGKRLFVEGSGGTIACLEAADGKVVWTKSFVSDFGGVVPQWGFSESPLVDGDKVIYTPGGRGATIVALNKATGAVIWKSEVPGGDKAGYSSCIVADIDGQRQYIQFTSVGVVGVAAKDGKFLWRYDHPGNKTGNISTPIYRDHIVFAASAYKTGAGAAKLETKDGQVTATELYFTTEMQNHHGGVVLLGENLYGFDNGTLRCLDFKTGETKWSNGSVGKGSVTCVDGMLYARGENKQGAIALIEATPKGYVEKGRFTQPDRTSNPAWAHPVIANGRLYICDQGSMYCYDIKAK